MAGQAEILARGKAKDALSAMRHMEGGHPALGGASLEAIKPVSTDTGDLKSVMASLLEAAQIDTGVVARVRATADDFDALEIVADEGLNSDVLSDAQQDELKDALASIETAIRLGAYRGRYQAFWDGFYGKIEAIRGAHRQFCVCGEKVASTGDKTR